MKMNEVNFVNLLLSEENITTAFITRICYIIYMYVYIWLLLDFFVNVHYIITMMI